MGRGKSRFTPACPRSRGFESRRPRKRPDSSVIEHCLKTRGRRFDCSGHRKVKYLKLRKYISKKVKNYKNRKNNINSKKFLKTKLTNIQNVNELIEFHFNTYSENEHINKEMFRLILNYFSGSSLNILETGSAAHGTKSSLLFASYIKLYGGKFDTVDTNPDIKKFYNFLESRNIRFHTEDSLTYIKNLDNRVIENLDLIYLDSYDLDLDNPSPSQKHGFNEFLLSIKN